VLLVDDDQPGARQRREHRHARAQHQVGVAGERQQPMAQPLRRRQRAVQADQQAGREARGETRLELRRQVDLGHQHQRLPAGRQRLRGGAQVDLGLARAGDAVQQRGAGRQAVERLQGPCLLVGQRRRALLARNRPSRRRRPPQARQPPRDLPGVEPAQLGRQHRQRQLADAALVVGGGEAGQCAPGRRQRRQTLEHLGQRPQRGRRRRVVGAAPRRCRPPCGGRVAPAPACRPASRAPPRSRAGRRPRCAAGSRPPPAAAPVHGQLRAKPPEQLKDPP
jgi:hypothetical protein